MSNWLLLSVCRQARTGPSRLQTSLVLMSLECLSVARSACRYHAISTARSIPLEKGPQTRHTRPGHGLAPRLSGCLRLPVCGLQLGLVPQGLSQGLQPHKDRGPSLSRMWCFALMTRPYPQLPTCITEFPILEPRICNFSIATMDGGAWAMHFSRETELSIRASSTSQILVQLHHATEEPCPWSSQDASMTR